MADVAALAAALVADGDLVDALTAAAVARRDEECRAEADALAPLVAKRHPDSELLMKDPAGTRTADA
ncbi:hypothetical protein [Actinacidiphila glaucinigra]|uniref:hypothetical protein n=1 Tax=Actinacidiphila glaucinigra TaxID=235986 RepID=UPI00371F6F4E